MLYAGSRADHDIALEVGEEIHVGVGRPKKSAWVVGRYHQRAGREPRVHYWSTHAY